MRDPITKETLEAVTLDQALLQRIRPIPHWHLCRRNNHTQLAHVTFADSRPRPRKGGGPTPTRPLPLCKAKGIHQSVMFELLGRMAQLCGVCYRRLVQIGALAA